MSGPFDITTLRQTESYAADHPLQTIDIYIVSRLPTALWIIFIHGGAWRDPLITSAAGTSLFQRLAPHHSNTNYASISYRLSPHPDHPVPTPPNTAKHPDHLNDVLASLQHLRTKHNMARYVLVGHSAGATLAFQSLSQPRSQHPEAVVGVEGIYDLTDMVLEYGNSYRSFVDGAFGPEEGDVWEDASAKKGADGYRGLVVLCHSDEDELLSWKQTEGFKEAVEDVLGPGGSVRVVKLVGGHGEVMEGDRLAGVVGRYVKELN